MPILTNYHWSSVFDCVMHETDLNGTTIATYTHEPGQFGPLISETRDSGRAGLSLDGWSELSVDDRADLPTSNPTEYCHHYDALGSTTMLTDATGAVTDTFQYDAWGNSFTRTGTTATPYQWIGRWGGQLDTITGSFYNRTGTYQPTVARWTSVRPRSTVLGRGRVILYGLAAPTDSKYMGFAFQLPNARPEASEPGQLNINLDAGSCSTTCDGITVRWIISAPAKDTIIYVTIVQYLVANFGRTDCFFNEDFCCEDDKNCRSECKFYEYLGTIVFDEARNNPLDLSMHLKETKDIWSYPSSGSPCVRKGTTRLKGDIRGFIDNNLLIHDEIQQLQDDWKSKEKLDCGCNVAAVPSRHKLKPPAWWGKPDFVGGTSYNGVYNCCNVAQNLALVSSSSGVNKFLDEC